MYEFGIYQPFEIHLKHYRHVTNKKVLHVVIRGTLVLFPNEVSNKSLYDKSILAYLV